MTFINESRSNKGLGFLCLQHHQRKDTKVGLQGYGKDGRHGIMAARVLGRLLPERLGGSGDVQDEDGFTGPYIADPDSFGDLIGSFLWNHSTEHPNTSGTPFGPTGERGFPGWRWSWPVLKVRKGEGKGDIRNEIHAMGFDVGDLNRLTNPTPNTGHWNADVREHRRNRLRDLLIDAVKNDRAGGGILEDQSNYLEVVAEANGLNPEWVREVGGEVLDGVPINDAIKNADESIKPPDPEDEAETHSSNSWHECPEMDDHVWQPIKGGATQDIDFAQKPLFHPFPGLKFPIGHTGLAMSGTYEWAQDETYYPTDPRLFAVNNHSDPLLSTHVCDTTEDFDIDLVKKARLHSFLKVIDNGPFCKAVGNICSDMEQKTLAWNITLSGCEDAYGGWVYDGKKKLRGAIEYDGLNGPFVLLKDDKHDLREEEEDEGGNGKRRLPVMARRTVVGPVKKKAEEDDGLGPVHIHLGALFSDSAGKMDAPKHHKGMWPEGVEQPNYKVYTWLTYHDDEEEKDEPEHLGPHPFVCKPNKGEIGWHRWYSDSYHNMHNPPPKDTPYRPGGISLDVPGVPVDPNTGAQVYANATPAEIVANNAGSPPVFNLELPPEGPWVGGLPGGGVAVNPRPDPQTVIRGDPPPVNGLDGNNEGPTGDAGPAGESGPGGDGGSPGDDSTTTTQDPKKKSGSTSTDTSNTVANMSNENTDTVKCYYYSSNEQGCGTMLWRAQHYTSDSIDYRNWFGQSQRAIESEKEYTPSVARLEAFGHQNPQEHRGPYCPGWNYTSGDEPDGTHKGRNECKTSNGGVVFMPPQYGVENYAGIISDPTAESTSSFIFAPGTKLSFGKPDVATGLLSTTVESDNTAGFNIYVASSGELQIETADGTKVFYIKQSGNVVFQTGVHSAITATGTVTGPTVAATTEATAPTFTATTSVVAPTGTFSTAATAPTFTAATKVEAPTVDATTLVASDLDITSTRVLTVGSATPLTNPSNVTKSIAFNGAGVSGTAGGISSGQSFLYTKDEGYGVLGLYYKNYYGETKIN